MLAPPGSHSVGLQEPSSRMVSPRTQILGMGEGREGKKGLVNACAATGKGLQSLEKSFKCVPPSTSPILSLWWWCGLWRAQFWGPRLSESISSFHEPYKARTLFLFPVGTWKNWGTETLSNFSKATQLISDWMRIPTQVSWLQRQCVLVRLDSVSAETEHPAWPGPAHCRNS